LWDEEEDLIDWDEDGQHEFPDHPEEAPEPVMDHNNESENEPVDLPEDVIDEPHEPHQEVWKE